MSEIFSGVTREFIENSKDEIYLYESKNDHSDEQEETDEESTLENEEIDTTNILELESEESAAQRRNQQGQGLKILTPNQMLSRLPITLAQLNAGNNSERLKNEIKQELYFLYRSKKLAKQIYKSLIDII